MPHTIKFYPIDGGKPTTVYGNRPYDLLIEGFAESAMPLGWIKDEDAPYDREFEDQCDRYTSLEMFGPDDYSVTVVFFDGQPIGTIGDPLNTYGISELETYEQMELRQGREDAARELHADTDREMRAAE